MILTHEESIQIETLFNEDKSKAYIAQDLYRSRSTITREVNKWVSKLTEKSDEVLVHYNAKDDYLNKRNLNEISIHRKVAYLYSN